MKKIYKNRSEREKAWRKANPEKAKAISRRRYLKHRQKVLTAAKNYRDNNREKVSASRRKYHQEHKNEKRTAEIRRKYKLLPHEVDLLLLMQGDSCAICRCIFDGTNFHVDHDHKTGKVRALLCKFCNLGLGYFRDSPSWLRIAAQYLEEHSLKKERGLLH